MLTSCTAAAAAQKRTPRCVYTGLLQHHSADYTGHVAAIEGDRNMTTGDFLAVPSIVSSPLISHAGRPDLTVVKY